MSILEKRGGYPETTFLGYPPEMSLFWEIGKFDRIGTFWGPPPKCHFFEELALFWELALFPGIGKFRQIRQIGPPKSSLGQILGFPESSEKRVVVWLDPPEVAQTGGLKTSTRCDPRCKIGRVIIAFFGLKKGSNHRAVEQEIGLFLC